MFRAGASRTGMTAGQGPDAAPRGLCGAGRDPTSEDRRLASSLRMARADDALVSDSTPRDERDPGRVLAACPPNADFRGLGDRSAERYLISDAAAQRACS